MPPEALSATRRPNSLKTRTVVRFKSPLAASRASAARAKAEGEPNVACLGSDGAIDWFRLHPEFRQDAVAGALD